MTGIQLTQDYDLSIKPRRDARGLITAGMVVGDILSQNQDLILTIHQGELKERPTVGCGISDMLLDYDPAAWRSLIREQMEMDGQEVRSIKITNRELTIDAYYR